jgi:hypothetical protein
MPPSDKRAGFFPAIRAEKLPTIKYCILNAGCDPCVTLDEEGHTGLQVAASLGKVRGES